MRGTMKALRMYAPYDFRIDEIPIPEIGPEEILIQVEGYLCRGYQDTPWRYPCVGYLARDM